MNYQLAKELHEAGFKRKHAPHGHTIENVMDADLEELIKALRGNNKPFVLQHHMGQYNGWTATRGKTTTKKHTDPVTAVANLWLALNKK